MECTKCKYNGKQCEACLSCDCTEQYNYRYSHYLIDGYDPKQESTEGSQKVTEFNDDVEDALRKALYTIFELDYLELLLLKAIMNGKTLTEFAKEITETLQKKSTQVMTRHHAFQLRKSIAKKFPFLKNALLTSQQRRPIKTS